MTIQQKISKSVVKKLLNDDVVIILLDHLISYIFQTFGLKKSCGLFNLAY
jgi:hypothetical protein